jgi:hypothetical protein
MFARRYACLAALATLATLATLSACASGSPAGPQAWVVMQQGWTPAGIYRDTLRLAARNFAPEIAKIGAKGAMYQTWPRS